MSISMFHFIDYAMLLASVLAGTKASFVVVGSGKNRLLGFLAGLVVTVILYTVFAILLRTIL